MHQQPTWWPAVPAKPWGRGGEHGCSHRSPGGSENEATPAPPSRDPDIVGVGETRAPQTISTRSQVWEALR